MSFRDTAGKTGMKILYIAAGAAAVFVAVKFVIPAMLPFIISFILAMILQRPVNFCEKKLKIPRGVSSAFFVLGITAAVFAVLFAAFSSAVREAAEFISEAASGNSSFLSGFSALTDKIGAYGDRFIKQIFPEAGESINTADMLHSVFVSAVKKAAAFVSSVIAGTVSAMPRALIFFIALIFSGIYFCADYPKIRAFCASRLSGKMKKYSSYIKKEGLMAAAGCAKSYFLIFLLTFGELFLGFVLMRQKGAFLLALITALVDILPVLGTGTVLLPWAAALLIIGKGARALKLLILYAVITVIRQIAEPRIVGNVTGLHPALTLICMYSGLRLAGAAGMIFLPVTVAFALKITELFHEAASEESK